MQQCVNYNGGNFLNKHNPKKKIVMTAVLFSRFAYEIKKYFVETSNQQSSNRQ